MLQPEVLLRMSKGHVETLRREAFQIALARAGRPPLRRRLARLLVSWSRSLDPALRLGFRDEETLAGPFVPGGRS